MLQSTILKKDFNLSFNPPDSRDSFNVLLFRLFVKSDSDNLKNLQKGFPSHFMIYHSWKEFGIQHDTNEILTS